MRQQKSMIVLNPFWKRVKATKKDKEQYKKQTGLHLQSFVLPTDKYYKLIEKLWVGGTEVLK